MEIETMADNHAHLLNVKENTQIAQIKQFITENATKWSMTLNNEPEFPCTLENLFHNEVDTEKVQAKQPIDTSEEKILEPLIPRPKISSVETVMNDKSVEKLDIALNKPVLVNTETEISDGRTEISNVTFDKEPDSSRMETDCTDPHPNESSNDRENSGIAQMKPLVNGFAPKSMPLKKQPDVLCNCPLQCDKKIGVGWRKTIYQQFQEIADHCIQNQFIQRHIKIKSIAKRLWKDEIVDKKIQRRVTCKYLIPMSGNINDSYSYAKTLSYDTVKSSLYSSTDADNQKESSNTTGEIQTDFPSKPSNTLPTLNGYHDPVSETRKSEMCDDNSPMSFNDSDSVNTSLDDMNSSDSEFTNSVKYVEVCQKAFMNMFGITEKRIRWQREKLILKSRVLAEKKMKEREEVDRTLALARSLGAGCQPLFALLEKSNCLHLSKQLMGAIEDDVALVNNFFHNQLWKPEDIMTKSLNLSSLDIDSSLETDCD